MIPFAGGSTAGGPSRRATGYAVAVLCLLLAGRLSDVVSSGEPGQVPFTVALFVLPVLYAFRGTRPLLDRYRWPVLAVQAVLTWVPFVIFGARWPAARTPGPAPSAAPARPAGRRCPPAMTTGQTAGRFSLTAELPLETRGLARSGSADPRPPWLAGRHSPALEQAAAYAGVQDG